MWVLWTLLGRPIYSHLALGGRVFHWEGREWSQIMFYNHLDQCLKSCFIIIWQLLAPLSSQPRVHKWAGSTTGWVPLWNRDSGADTWCLALEPMSQIMFYNHLATFGTIVKSAKGPQVGRFHNGMGPVVERGQWCGHLVSGHGTNVSNHVL